MISSSMSTIRCFLSVVMSAPSNASASTLNNSRVSNLSSVRRWGYAASEMSCACDECIAVTQVNTASFTADTWSKAISPDGYACPARQLLMYTSRMLPSWLYIHTQTHRPPSVFYILQPTLHPHCHIWQYIAACTSKHVNHYRSCGVWGQLRVVECW